MRVLGRTHSDTPPPRPVGPFSRLMDFPGRPVETSSAAGLRGSAAESASTTDMTHSGAMVPLQRRRHRLEHWARCREGPHAATPAHRGRGSQSLEFAPGVMGPAAQHPDEGMVPAYQPAPPWWSHNFLQIDYG